MRSDMLSIKKDFSFDKGRPNNKSEAKKRINNATLNHSVLKEDLSSQNAKIKQGMKLRKFSKSSKNENDTQSNRSNSRKNRILSNASSSNRISLEEFTKLKLENQQLKHLLLEMVHKFDSFKASVTKDLAGKSSESGSSIAYRISKQ